MRTRDEVLREFGAAELTRLLPPVVAESIERMADRIRELEADAKRYRWITRYLSVDGDVIGSESGKHVQWVQCDDKLSDATSREGWTHTVNSLIDAAMTPEVNRG